MRGSFYFPGLLYCALLSDRIFLRKVRRVENHTGGSRRCHTNDLADRDRWRICGICYEQANFCQTICAGAGLLHRGLSASGRGLHPGSQGGAHRIYGRLFRHLRYHEWRARHRGAVRTGRDPERGHDCDIIRDRTECPPRVGRSARGSADQSNRREAATGPRSVLAGKSECCAAGQPAACA